MASNPLQLTFSHNKLTELTTTELLQCSLLRQSVFIIEQQCLYPDLDDLDFDALHVQARNGEQELVAYLRLLAPGVSYKEPAIGRVAVDANFRRRGIGLRLLQEGVRLVRERYAGEDIKLSAQTYTLSMYRAVGFEETGDPYLEDGIPHQAMVLRATDSA